LKNGYNRKSFVLDWLAPVQAPGYNVDDGFFIGLGVIYKKQQFGKSPYGSMQALAGKLCICYRRFLDLVQRNFS
jgi:hypothetical protein